MADFGYTFDKDHKWRGTILVTIDGHQYQTSGIIEYSRENRFYAEIIFSSGLKSAGLFNTFMGKGIDIGTASAIVVDEATKTSFCLSLVECVCRIRELGTITRAIIYPRFVLASKGYFFEPTEDKITKIDAEYNVWGEFNCPKGFSKRKKLVELHSRTELDDGFSISCCEGVRGDPLFDFKADEIFVGPQEYLDKITDAIRPLVLELAQKKSKKISDYIWLKTPDSHRWYVRFENQKSSNAPSVMEYVQKSWMFSNLLMLLTHEWRTSVYRIYLHIDSKETGPFELLYSADSVNGKDDYSYFFQDSGFNIASFTKNEWSNLLKQFYKNYDLIQDHLSILHTNNKGRNFSFFHLSRIIDCLSVIGQDKGYNSKTKYQDVLNNYLGKRVSKRLEKYLTPINSQNLGMQISDLRTSVVHFNTKNKPDIELAFNVYPLLQLIVIDFIFEKIKLSRKLRKKYKDHYLKRYLRGIT